jgi:hypothetical protein
MKFRKRPVVIEARVFDPSIDYDEALAVIVWAGGWINADGDPCIDTLEGEMQARPGDWIIRGVKGEFYPCKPDIFAATYEPVS